MKTKIVASSFVRRLTDGKYLVLKRSKTDLSRQGEWDLAGGMVDGGETIRDGALRELREEVGFKQVESCVLLYSASGVAFSPSHQEVLNYVFLFFLIDVNGDEPVTLSFEHDEYVWVEQDNLKEHLTHKAQSAAYRHIFENGLAE